MDQCESSSSISKINRSYLTTNPLDSAANSRVNEANDHLPALPTKPLAEYIEYLGFKEYDFIDGWAKIEKTLEGKFKFSFENIPSEVEKIHFFWLPFQEKTKFLRRKPSFYEVDVDERKEIVINHEFDFEGVPLVLIEYELKDETDLQLNFYRPRYTFHDLRNL